MRSKARLFFLEKHQGEWQTRWMCETLSVVHGGFYAWLRRPSSERAVYYAMLEREIESSFLSSGWTCGARWVWQDLLTASLDSRLQRIERLMGSLASRARTRRRRQPSDTEIRLLEKISAGTIDRNF
jgi:putative transposase